MAGLMPSEIARLVLGYLKETKCYKTSGMFLNESAHLSEYVECLLQGKEYPTTINGKTLLDILNEYAELKCREGKKTSNETPQMMCSRSLLLSAREGRTSNSISVGCGDSDVHGLTQSSCQTSPPASLVETGTQVEVQATPAKCSRTITSFNFSTPTCRPVDLYSSPSTLVKSVLLSFQESDVTPTKNSESESCYAEFRSNSPRRKGPLPRKRLYSPSNPSSYTPSKRRQGDDCETASCSSTPVVSEDAASTSSANDAVDVTALIDGMLHNSVLHERIAANINHEKSHPTLSISEISDEDMPEMIIKNIVDRTESDPVFEAFLNVFLDKHDGNSRDSLCSQQLAVETNKEMETSLEPSPATVSGGCVTVAPEVSASSAKSDEVVCNWSQQTTAIQTTVNQNESLAYILPLDVTNNGGSVFQIVLSGASEQLNTSAQVIQVNQNQLKPCEPVATNNQFQTLSPGQLYTVFSAPGESEKQINLDKQISNLCRRPVNNSDDPLKRAFIRRHCAVKSLDFGQDLAARPAATVLKNKLPKTHKANLIKDRISGASVSAIERQTATANKTLRPRLQSLIRSAENLEKDKTSDDAQVNILPSEPTSKDKKTKEPSKRGTRGSRAKKTQSKESRKSTSEQPVKSKNCDLSSAQAVLNKMNVDEFLSGIQYVD